MDSSDRIQYNGTATSIMMDWKFISGCTIGLLLLISGIVLVSRPVKRSASLQATVHSGNCDQTTCSYTASFTLNRHVQLITLTSSSLPVDGSTITLYYDLAHLSDISTSSGNYQIGGWICIGVGVLVFVLGILFSYFTHKTT